MQWGIVQRNFESPPKADPPRAEKNQRNIFVFLFLCCVVFLIFAPLFVHAQADVDVGLAPLEQTGLTTRDIRAVTATIIRSFLGLLGLIGVSLVLYGGFLWMTSGGNEEKIEKAKKVLTNASIGLAIVLLSYTIASFVISRFLSSVGGGDEGGGRGTGIPGGRGGLGGGIIESHYPARNARGIARNTKIIVSFKEAMDVASLLNTNNTPEQLDDDVVNAENVKIRKTIDDPRRPESYLTLVHATRTSDDKTFVFKPDEPLGSASEDVSYTVTLATNIKKKNGDGAFGSFGAYEWRFEVGTFIDSTPPRIESVLPPDTSTQPRNVVVQMTFNEAMDPTTVTGTTAKGFNNIIVAMRDGRAVQGTFTIANQYRTVEFVTNDLCGRNSCGGDVFCLPGDKDVLVTIKAPTLKDPGKSAEAVSPPDGVTDVAGNSFDGDGKDADGNDTDGNGKAEGPPTDHYSWYFKTTNKIDLEPPVIESVTPQKFGSEVSRTQDVRATFSKLMMASSLTTEAMKLQPNISYWTSSDLTPAKDKTIGIISHERFDESTTYSGRVTSLAKDLYQNCYQPCVGP